MNLIPFQKRTGRLIFLFNKGTNPKSAHHDVIEACHRHQSLINSITATACYCWALFLFRFCPTHDVL